MLVAMYHSHNSLPFSQTPAQPWGVFDPEKMKGWWCYKEGIMPPLTFQHSFMYPILLGLHSLDLPKIMANVSCHVAEKQEHTYWVERCWVQITTIPKDYSDNGIPHILKHGWREVQVLRLWDGGNRTFDPRELLDDEEKNTIKQIPSSEEKDFWKMFFLKELVSAYKKEKDELIKKQERIDNLFLPLLNEPVFRNLGA